MADYFTKFSCQFDVENEPNAARAKQIIAELAAEIERDDGIGLGFEMLEIGGTAPGALWLYSDDNGEPEHVIAFVLRCAEAFNLTGLWGFRWALTCSRSRPDGFGGGAHVIDLGKRQTRAWTDCETWLAEQLSNPTDVATISEETS